MRVADKSKPTLNRMVQAFRSYMKATGKTSATFKQVVMSKDGLGWEGTYSEWYNGNKHRNMTKIFTEWQDKKTPDGYHFVKVRRGQYFPSQGDGIRKFSFRSRSAKAVPVSGKSAIVQPELPFDQPTTSPRAANVKGVLIIPVTSVDRFHSILDSLKGVLDDPDHDFLEALLNDAN